MTRLFFALLVATAALSQGTLLPELGLLEVLPNLVLVLLLVWSALRGIAEGVVWVFGTGLLLDLLAMDPLGTNGLALLVAAVLGGGPGRRRFFHSGMIFPILLTMLATVGYAAVIMLLRGLDDSGAMLPAGAIVRLTFLQSLLNGLLVPPLYLVAGWIDRWAPEKT